MWRGAYLIYAVAVVYAGITLQAQLHGARDDVTHRGRYFSGLYGGGYHK